MIWKYGIRFASTIAESAGYLLMPKWRLTTWVHSRALRVLLRENNIDCVFDVGANRGQFRDFLRDEVGYNGLILSFEPIHHLAELCKARSVSDPNWDILEIALGDEEVTIPINITKSDDLSSFLTPLADQPFTEESVSVRTEMVKVKTLDSLFNGLQSKYKFNNIFFKIDTQGFDLSVIKGSETSLNSVYMIQTELSVVPIYKEMPTWIAVISALKERGFEISGLYEVNKDRNSRVVEFDGVFVKATAPLG